MTDNPESENPEVLAEDAPPPEPTVEDEQNFIFWVAAIPFFIGAGIFFWQYMNSQNMTQLINAAGILILGIFVGAVANAFAGDKSLDEKPPEDSSHPVS